MSKILVLSGSPRKGGNTDELVAAFCKGAAKHEVEVVSVRDIKVNPCIACDSCFKREHNECFQNDDMRLIYDKMKSADIVIIASPVYFYGVSAQLKCIIDRCHNPIRNTFNIKKLGLILVGAASLPTLFDSIITQYELVMKFFNLSDAGKVLIRGAKGRGDLPQDDVNKAFLFGESIQ